MRGLLLCAVATGVLMASAVTGGAQVVDLDVALNQSVTSVNGLHSPTGVYLGLTSHRLIGRVGLQVSYRRLVEGGGEISGYCGAFFCTTGPFDESRFLNTAAVGLTLDVGHANFGDVKVGFVTSFSFQGRDLVHVDTGEETRRASVGPDLGFGLFGDVRLPSVGLGLRPLLYGRYERIGASDCVADGSCLGGRHVGSVGLGLALRLW